MNTTPTQTKPFRFSLSQLLFGKPIATRDLEHQNVNRIVGLAVFASDALSSTAYATEEILFILALAGTSSAVLGISIPLSIAIAVLLTIVTISYRQTIYAYPNGGGAYIVARDNLGEVAAQIAGAALLTDYILTVAVSISSGVAQIASAFPVLLPFRVEIALLVILIMTLVNLRGVKESGTIFAIPTYFFLITMLLTLLVGLYRYFAGTLGVVTGVEMVETGTVQALTLFLILRAFSSGSAALTGIEAISNGITAFKEPRSHNAAVTLQWMSGILITIFLSITFLAHQIHAVPSEAETIISQLGRVIFGNGSILYLAIVAGTALILLMAANTSYADFPRLAALHAGDGFLPRQLTFRGGRLVFNWGVVTLATMASLLVIVMNARTTALIPLYAIGVFLSFTISQTGMVVRLRKIGRLKPGEKIQGLETVMAYDPRWRLKMVISGLGAVCTGIVMLIFAVTKFTSGAWFVILLIPVLVLAFFRVHHHYKAVARNLSLEKNGHDITTHPVQTVVLVDGVHAGTVDLVNFAKSLKHPWHAVHIGINPEKASKVSALWDAVIGEGELVVVPSPYRQLNRPIRTYIENLLLENPDTIVHVVVGHLAMETAWEQALHQNSVLIFNLALNGLERVVLTIVPHQIHRHQTEEGVVDRNVFTPADLRSN
ncbi:MAG: APC family permease [Ardenticatenaceae bacterium]|nr:APC family permease [Ardenticatenaceae bacterium]MCB9442796.1 APC family permease [Ardenticatenaceae bacterium]